MIRGKTLLLVLLGAVALGTGIWLGQILTRQALEPALQIAGIYLPEPRPVKDFSLIHHSGRPFTKEDFKGRWSFLYFGYTYCPDICPMALIELNKFAESLEQQGLNENTAFTLVSVDPDRDTPQRLGEYTTYFNKSFQGATGSREQIDNLVEQFGAVYNIPKHDEDDNNYVVDHSSTVIVIDPDARLHAIFTPPHEPDTMLADFIKIRERYLDAS